MSIFRPIYTWALGQARKPYADGLLFLLALTEPCVSPIPPDVLMVPMAIAHPARAYRFAGICLIGLLIGCVFGYGIGALAMDSAGQWLITTYHLENELVTFNETFARWGVLILVAKGLVPIVPVPLIVLMVASGAAKMNPLLFGLSFGLSQATRLFLEAWLVRRYGDPVRNFIERYLTWIGVTLVSLVGAFVWLLA